MTPMYCYNCINYTGSKLTDNEVIETCKAFPKGIPKKIILLEETHDTVKPNQVGTFVFEEKK